MASSVPKLSKSETPAFPSIGYLGRHTAISHLPDLDWKKLPLLGENRCQLPPYIIAVGDRRRVRDAADILRLSNACLVDEEAGKMRKGAEGRVSMLVGHYDYKGLAVPLAVVETQMGVSALQINLLEILAHTSVLKYSAGGRVFSSHLQANVIRAGTAGGINDPSNLNESVMVGDIVNATFSAGHSGALMQSIGGLNFLHAQNLINFSIRWMAYGYDFLSGGDYPFGKSDPRLVEAISLSGKELGVRVVEGGNFTKDSLYAESNEKSFISLRKKYGIMSTEMEQMGILALAGKFRETSIRIASGLVSGLVGVLPGASFAGSDDEKVRAAKVESDILVVSAHALGKLALDNLEK